MMPDSLKEQMQTDFLNFLRDILTDQEQMDIAARERKAAFVDDKPVALSTVDKAGVFDEAGNINSDRCKALNITFDANRVGMQNYEQNNLTKLSFRERLVLESAISSAHNKLFAKYASMFDEIAAKLSDQNPDAQRVALALMTDFKDIYQATPKIALAELQSRLSGDKVRKHPCLLTQPNSLEIVGSLRQGLNQGFYRFKDTNIIISPGPILHPDENQDSEKYLRRFYSNLQSNQVRHVFAIGIVEPHHPQDGLDLNRPVAVDIVRNEDFCNYFIPGSDGKIKLPLPEYQDFDVKSRLIKKRSE